jgi:hypothetical protein
VIRPRRIDIPITVSLGANGRGTFVKQLLFSHNLLLYFQIMGEKNTLENLPFRAPSPSETAEILALRTLFCLIRGGFDEPCWLLVC